MADYRNRQILVKRAYKQRQIFNQQFKEMQVYP